ncbi:MAG: DUF1801 domain-containing protein [Bacteroidetes bacterium]|nr:MAG: DUF1801 domain-containing protein [Bacteroidota bacterium]
MNKPTSVDQYIAQYKGEAESRMKLLRAMILELAPDAAESIAYGMPAYKTFHKPLVYFAGYEQHIGLYATPSGHEQFAQELSIYKQGKGSVQFPLKEDFPIELIRRIVAFRVAENQLKYGPKS